MAGYYFAGRTVTAPSECLDDYGSATLFTHLKLGLINDAVVTPQSRHDQLFVVAGGDRQHCHPRECPAAVDESIPALSRVQAAYT